MNTFEFLFINAFPGSYARRYDDYSRPGATGHTFFYTGTRGDRNRLPAMLKGGSEEEALTTFSELEAQIGTELIIQDVTNSRQWTVFLHNAVMTESYAIGGRVDTAQDNWRIVLTLDVTRTA